MSNSKIRRQSRYAHAALRKLRNIERHGSRRAKVFAKRARRLGWTAESIVAALSYGFEHFRAPIEF
ncbi:hypothetical protein KDW55_02295 [Burkholderia sp. AU19243]|uniref:hypothetical protein n=1 Tax=Burkholderia sp. AU19243 TaxID=2824810 RepID=UPI001B9C104E|nr:hypothetical protein [Burkholderia sp. AU19243]MBR8362148.1 hypothetical protein [Burkholderia sp. AU19243]